ncbi:MAG: HEPN domain-containing protein, partial [Desulfobacterales bacterium]
MSTEKNIGEALRWFRTAEDDLDSAKILKDSGKYAHSCFHSQQAAEKSLKSVWYLVDEDPWGHSIKKLIDDLESVKPDRYKEFEPLTRIALVLDRFYIPTRYPNGLPDITPDVAFTDEDA